MLGKFAPVDDVLIERLFQPACNLIRPCFGIGHAAAACLCLDLASLSWIFSRTGGMLEAMSQGDIDAAAFGATVLLLGLVALVSLRTLFHRMRGTQENSLRQAMRPHRGIVLLMLLARLLQLQAPDLGMAADLAMLLFASSALYLGACAERPRIKRNCSKLVSAD
jgi:hypothetical protein